MVVQKVMMDEDDDLEALRLAALQTIRPRKPSRRTNSGHRQKGQFYQPKVNPNLITIVPSVLPPSADTSRSAADTNKTCEKVKISFNTDSKEDFDVKEKVKEKPLLRPNEKSKAEDKDKSEFFDLEEDVLDFETESIGGSEEDTLQLQDSDEDSLERLMEQIEEELSVPVNTNTILPKKKPKVMKTLSVKSNHKVTYKNKLADNAKSVQKPGSPKVSVLTVDRSSPIRRKPTPPQYSNFLHNSPKRSRSPVLIKKSSISPKRSPRKRSISPRKRSLTPRKRSMSPRKRSLTPRRRSITPMKRSLTPRMRSISPRKRSVSPRRRSITPRKRSMSPRRRSPWRYSPRRRSISPRHRRSISPRRRSPIVDRRRSPSPWGRGSPSRWPALSPRRRSPSPKKRSLSPRRRSITPKKRSLSPRKRSISPKQCVSLKRQRARSPSSLKRGKRISPISARRNWPRNKTSSSMSNRINISSKSSFNDCKIQKNDESRKKKGDVRDAKAKDREVELVDNQVSKNGEIKPLDPVLEARRRKFQTTSIVEPTNKRIRLKSESIKRLGIEDKQSKSDENMSARIKRKRIVISSDEKKNEKEPELKIKPLLPKVTNKLKKEEEKKVDEEIVIKKKRRDISPVIKDDSKKEKGGVDLRAELSRRRAERLKGAPFDPMTRIVQSALEGAVGKIKSKQRSPPSEPYALNSEKKSKPKGRRVHVLATDSLKTEDKKNSTQDKPVGISIHYRSSSPVRSSGRSILRRNQV